MTTKHFITLIIAAYSIGISNVAVCASSYISHEPLKDQLPAIIIGSLSGISLFLLVNWLFKPRANKDKKIKKRR
ncbi:MAG: hypothetical protein WCK96_06295 [Methylococcales bacterium]